MYRCALVGGLLSIALAACSFSGAGGDPDGMQGGGRDGGAIDARPPGPPRCKFSYVDVCSKTVGPALNYQADVTINTSVDGACTHMIAQGAGKPELCVLLAPSITIAENVTVRGVGARPLVFVSLGAVTISGRLDASSTRARGGTPESVGAAGDAVACIDFTDPPESNAGGGGGGAGASCSGQGAAGAEGSIGSGNTGKGGRASGPVPAQDSAFARGGCRGQTGGGSGGSANGGIPGLGGPPGGSIYVAASGDITIGGNGRVSANGGGGLGGGSLAGGGGGGSGGWIALEATKVHRLGIIVANGGGGGEGGQYFNTPPLPPAQVPGDPGSDGLFGNAAAKGGDSILSGSGGDGSAGTSRNGGGAGASFGGGGGGGGAAGFIRLLGTVDGNGVLSPPAS